MKKEQLGGHGNSISVSCSVLLCLWFGSSSLFGDDLLLDCKNAIARKSLEIFLTESRSVQEERELRKYEAELLGLSYILGEASDFETLLEFGMNPNALVDVNVLDDVILGLEKTTPKEFGGKSVVSVVVRNWRSRKTWFEPALRYTRQARQVDEDGNTLWHLFLTSVREHSKSTPVHLPDAIVLESIGSSFCDTNKLGQTPIELYLAMTGSGSETGRDAGELMQFITYLDAVVGGFTDPGVWLSVAINKPTWKSEIERSVPDWVSRLREGDRLNKSWDEKVKICSWEYGLTRIGGLFSTAIDEEVSMAVQGYSGVVTERGRPKNRELNDLTKIWNGPRVVGTGGFTFLFGADLKRNREATIRLLELGANPDVRLTRDLTDFGSKASLENNCLSYSPKAGDSVVLANMLNPCGRLDSVNMYLPHTKDADQRDRLSRNMLHLVLFHRFPRDQIEILGLLVDAGTNINAQSISGATPAHNAVIRNATLIPHLVELGADLQLKDWRGESVIDRLRQSVREKWTFWEESQETLEKLGYEMEE